MNKLLKGAIAGAAGVALLLGGAGTFASWNSSSAITGGPITAGTLAITGSTAGTWKSGTTDIDLAKFKSVPGDVLTFTKSLTISASGDNLKAVLSINPASIAASTTAAADVELAKLLSNPANVSLTATGTDVTLVTAGVYKVTTATTSVVVTVTIKFPSGTAGAENNTQAGSVNLSNLAVLLTQS
jgi:alternate signal-mediated exported protein